MTNPGSISIRDYSDEITVTRFNMADTVTTAAPLTTIAADLFNNFVILGLPFRTSLTLQDNTGIAGPIPSTAQRELKWAVSYEDNQEFLDPGTDLVQNPGFLKRFTFELGTANTDPLSPGSDILDPATTQWTTIQNALTDVRSPYGGTVSLLEVRLVGRAI